MKLMIFRFFTKLHVLLYRLSGGRIGGSMSDVQILLLESVGRKTGKRRTTPLAYIRDGGDYVVTASNGGEPHHPGWYYNLHSQPQTVIQVMEERRRLWAELVKTNPRFDEYQSKTAREIAMFILHPSVQSPHPNRF
jgi:deazaflavin-dependent oxidoreductase (nitroreductase family)